MMRRVAAVALGVGLVVGCGESREVAPSPRPRGVQQAASSPDAPASKPAKPPPLFGPDGELLESDQGLAGLKLPQGLKLESRDQDRHRYRSSDPRITYDALVDYFGPRLFTGQVEQVGQGLIYRSAVPQTRLDSRVKLDVWITPGKRGTVVVELRERSPATRPRSVSELRRELEAQRTQQE